MRNNKGMTIVEIIVAVTLVSIVLIFLLNLLITVKNQRVQNEMSSNLIINKAVLTKAIEDDINEFNLVAVSVCDSDDIGLDGKKRIIPVGATNIYCLKLTYDSNLVDDNFGYILQYTYQFNTSNTKSVVAYKRGTNQVVRGSVSMNPNEFAGKVSSSCSSGISDKCSLKITMPVIDDDGNNYDIEVSYIYSSNTFSYNASINNYGFIIE